MAEEKDFDHGMPVRRAAGKDHMLAYPFTSQDKGGERELRAHRENRQFKCTVRSDGLGGYNFFDPEKDTMVSGRRYNKDGGQLQPSIVHTTLRVHDRSAWVLESMEKDLDLIKRERDLIDHFRTLGHDNPLKSAQKRLDMEVSVWDEAVKAGIKPSDWLDATLRNEDPMQYSQEKAYHGAPLTTGAVAGSSQPSMGQKVETSGARAKGK